MSKTPIHYGKKDAPSGPASKSGGADSARDKNTRGAATKDSTKRAAAIEDGDEGDDGRIDTNENEDNTTKVKKKEKERPEKFVVLTEGAIIDDGEGGDIQMCKHGDVVTLTPSRAAMFQERGVPIVSKKEHDEANEAA